MTWHVGLLRERPLYGYEIKQIIEDHRGDWTSIAFGSIYVALGKLADEGFIAKVTAENAQQRGLNGTLTWRTGDAKDMPFPDGEFDLVVSPGSLHHWENPLPVLNEIARAQGERWWCRRE